MTFEKSDGSYKYRTKEITETLNISRASLVYYENIGLLSPAREGDGGYREYSDADIFKVISYAALRNTGLSANEIVEFNSNHDNLFDDECLEYYMERTRERERYYRGMTQAIKQLKDLNAHTKAKNTSLVDIPEFLFFADNAEQGYKEFKKEVSLDLLLSCVPMAGLGISFSNVMSGSEYGEIWGRTIRRSHSHLISLPNKEASILGGCACFCRNACIENVREKKLEGFFEELFAEIEECGYSIVGDPFVPYAFPREKDTLANVCVPAEAKSL